MSNETSGDGVVVVVVVGTDVAVGEDDDVFVVDPLHAANTSAATTNGLVRLSRVGMNVSSTGRAEM
jgi:hypothetical protein